MKKSVGVIDSLTGAQLSDKEVGTPADNITIDQLTLLMEKQDGSKFTNSRVSNDQGGVQLNGLSADLTGSSCVKKLVSVNCISVFSTYSVMLYSTNRKRNLICYSDPV